MVGYPPGGFDNLREGSALYPYKPRMGWKIQHSACMVKHAIGYGLSSMAWLMKSSDSAVSIR